MTGLDKATQQRAPFSPASLCRTMFEPDTTTGALRVTVNMKLWFGQQSYQVSSDIYAGDFALGWPPFCLVSIPTDITIPHNTTFLQCSPQKKNSRFLLPNTTLKPFHELTRLQNTWPRRDRRAQDNGSRIAMTCTGLVYLRA
jgi:hypothetical protein